MQAHETETRESKLLSELMTVNPVIVDADTQVDEAAWIFNNYGFRHLPVVECDRLLGIVSDHDLRLATSLLPASERLKDSKGHSVPGVRKVREIMKADVEIATPDDLATESAQRMVRGRFGALPVVEDDRVVGIVTETDFMRAFDDLCRQSKGACDDLVRYHAGEVGTDIHPDVDVVEALGQLDAATRHALVTEGGRIVGLLSDRDLLMGLSRSMIQDARAQEEGRLCETGVSVRQVMSTRVVSVEPGCSLGQAVRTMLGHRYSALPVLDGDLPLGILTQRDVLTYYASIC